MSKGKELEDINYIKETYDSEPYFKLLDLYFNSDSQALVRHHLNSFDNLIEEIIPSIFCSNENIIYENISENTMVRYRLTFEDMKISQPTSDNDNEIFFPLDAIQKELTYSARYTATVTQWKDVIDVNTGKKKSSVVGKPEPNIPIAKIPIMVRSKYCNLSLNPDFDKRHCIHDKGGYFIINGNEKVVISIEEKIKRKPIVTTRKDQNNIIYQVSIASRPVQQFVGGIQNFNIVIKKDSSMVVNIPQFKEVDVFIFMRALGFESDRQIIDSILDPRKDKIMFNQLMVFINSKDSPPYTQEEAIEVLVSMIRSTRTYNEVDSKYRYQQKKKYLLKTLSQNILPHVCSRTSKANIRDEKIEMMYKGYFIGYAIRKLLKHYIKGTPENPSEDDRDSMINKRIETSGLLMASICKQHFDKMINECSKMFSNKYTNDEKTPNIISQIKSTYIDQGLRKALAIGDFGSKTKSGLSQMLSRLNYLQTLSFLRRVMYPLDDPSKNKNVNIRHLHSTQPPSLCPFETPEGNKVGIIKNLSLICTVTANLKNQVEILEEYFENKLIKLEEISGEAIHTYFKIFINDNWIGITDNIEIIHEDLRKKRFKGEINMFVSLSINYIEMEYKIFTDSGRLIRPYLTVTNNKINFKPSMLNGISTWNEFMEKHPGVIEYVDKDEEQNMMLSSFPDEIEKTRVIATRKKIPSNEEIMAINYTDRYTDQVYVKYSHCEIHPSTMMGVVSTNIPFSDHNFGVRNLYQYSQGRQALGVYSSDFRERIDISYILYHPQVPITLSRVANYTGAHIFSNGENCMVAIMSWTGYNQEDSLILNGSSIAQGLFRAQTLNKKIEKAKKNQVISQSSVFFKPDRSKVEGMEESTNYSKLNENGYADAETPLQDGDAYIGIGIPKAAVKSGEKPYHDASVIYKSLTKGAVDKVFTGISTDGYQFVKVRLRSEKIPQVGDKFCCYDDKTQILTNAGWIEFKDLTLDHEVASLGGGKLKYQKPSHIFQYNYNGDLKHFKSEFIDLLVTPNHNMCYQNDDNNINLMPATAINSDYRHVKYLSDYQGAPESNIIRVFTDFPFLNNMQEILDTLVNILSSPFHLINEKYCNTALINKFIKFDNNSFRFQDWIWNLSDANTKYILKKLLLRSNTSLYQIVCEDNKCIMESTNLLFLEDLQRLALHAGFAVDFLKSNQVVIYFHDNFVIPYDAISSVHYEGKIYCCTVKNSMLCVRRNGIVSFSGNSRHGQKGTIGIKEHRINMPFTENGIVPDIIINPNCIPGRMTIGQMVESLASKYCVAKGFHGDATPFMKIDFEKLNQGLVDAGYNEWGNEVMFNGHNGEKIKTKIYLCPTFYQRLRQMAMEKIHARSRGHTQLLNRQPPEGRSRDGGLRIGEMEKDAMCAHGMAMFIKEKMMHNSDIYSTQVCDICGILASYHKDGRHFICRACNNTTRISKIIIPYAFKLLVQELMAINILPRLRTSKSINIPR